jgi:DNA-directed RNA polymerase subunit RPC12/RpoP
MLESVEIRGEIKDLGSKDGKTFALKLEAELEAEEIVDLYALQRNGRVVITFEPQASQQSLPMDKPAEKAEDVPGQAKLFGTDGKPRFRVRCEHCHTETTQRVWSESEANTTYLCDVCGELNVFKKLSPDDGQGDTAGDVVAAVDIEEPVMCPECESDMELGESEGKPVWICVNTNCLHQMTDEELAARNREDGDRPLICPECGSEQFTWGKGGQVCDECGHTLSFDEAISQANDDRDDPVACPKCGAPMDWSEGLNGWVCSAEGCNEFVTARAEGEEDGDQDDEDEPSDEPVDDQDEEAILRKEKRPCECSDQDTRQDLISKPNGDRVYRCLECGKERVA